MQIDCKNSNYCLIKKDTHQKNIIANSYPLKEQLFEALNRLPKNAVKILNSIVINK